MLFWLWLWRAQMSQLVKESSSLFWMVVHSFTESLGREGLPIGISVNCTAKYVDQKYGKVIIVFDGYTSTSTRSMAQQWRAGGKEGATVTFTDDMKITMKDHFLANKTNKQSFINMLSRYLQQANCQLYHLTANANLFIAIKAACGKLKNNGHRVVRGWHWSSYYALLSCRVRCLQQIRSQKQIPLSVDCGI